jgi:3-hydroxyacyl-[acyl-carrier-protein] dehydratase
MRFSLLDRIVEIKPGVSITASKVLSPDEEYLKDHFPRFAVLPGVLMLECMYQASAWLIRQTEGFTHSAVLLKEARNVKYSDFVTPGKELLVTAEILKQDDTTTTLKAQGTIDGNVAVAARLILERFNIGDRIPTRANVDPYSCNHFREVFKGLLQPRSSGTVMIDPPHSPGTARMELPHTSQTR